MCFSATILAYYCEGSACETGFVGVSYDVRYQVIGSRSFGSEGFSLQPPWIWLSHAKSCCDSSGHFIVVTYCMI